MRAALSARVSTHDQRTLPPRKTQTHRSRDRPAACRGEPPRAVVRPLRRWWDGHDGRGGWARRVLSPELLQQRFRVLEVGRVKALREPAVDRRQQLAGSVRLALPLPQPGQAHGGAQF